MAKYRKFFASLTAFVTLVVGTEFGAESKWYVYAVGALATAGVFFFPNAAPEGP